MYSGAIGAVDPALGSTLGKQIPSNRKSGPSYSFGKSEKIPSAKVSNSPGAYRVARALTRTTFSKTAPAYSFGSGARSDFTQGRKSPGPKYAIPTATFGPQVLSNYRSDSGSRFGTASRDQAARAGLSKEMAQSPNFANKEGPGPSVYTLPASLGRQTSTAGGMEPKPEWGWGTAERFPDRSSGPYSPGPATAKFGTLLGTQQLACYKSSPSISFGKGDSRADAFRAESDRSPGPIYSPFSSVGKQVITGARTPPQFSFGTSKRDGRTGPSNTPGPGSYNAV
ncbi:hypothetical protein T492DRAFT_1053011 [Pavlovales sp. CCMP2436]|nr:hypothetical protein T492DRAFT_1053011 [Pavlovales sp. CCMP2436]